MAKSYLNCYLTKLQLLTQLFLSPSHGKILHLTSEYHFTWFFSSLFSHSLDFCWFLQFSLTLKHWIILKVSFGASFPTWNSDSQLETGMVLWDPWQYLMTFRVTATRIASGILWVEATQILLNILQCKGQKKE